MLWTEEAEQQRQRGKDDRWKASGHMEGWCVCVCVWGEITVFEWWEWQRLMSAQGQSGSSNKDTVAQSGFILC